jgi:hypothetical protein
LGACPVTHRESDRIIEATSVARMATQIDTSVGHALETVVMSKILPAVKPSFLFAKRYTTGVNGTPGDVLESRLHALEMEMGRNLALPTGIQHPVIPAQMQAVPEETQVQMDEILRRLNAQEAHNLSLQEANVTQANTISMMHSAMASDVCEIGGESFDSELAARAFGLANRVGEMPTCAIDAVSMLQVAHNEVIDTASAVEGTLNAVKAGFSDLLESTVATSYQIHIPTVLGGKKPTGGHPLPAFKTYELWNDKSSISERASTEESLKQAESSLKEVIMDSLMTTKEKELAKQMVDQSAIVIAKLFMFMDRFYAELCNTYGTSAAEAWHLVSGVVRRFFGDLYAVRGRAKFLPMKKAKTDMIGGAFLWASLQAHRVMSEYLAADFRHHPSVAPVITIHLYSHRVPVSIYESRSRKVDAELKRIGESVKTANTTAGEALKKVGA